MEQAVINQKDLIDRLRTIGNQAQFVSFTYRNKEADELARHTLVFGSSYIGQIEESLLALELLAPTFTSQLEKQASEELKRSFEQTISSFANGQYNPKYTKAHSYVHISKGLKYCLSTGIINVSGLAHKKVVLEPGVYPVVHHKPLTEAKIQIKSKLPVARWREFCINLENMESARLQGVELVLND